MSRSPPRRRVVPMSSRIRSQIPSLVLLVGAILPAAARAQGKLLVTNPEFDAGLAGWTTGVSQTSTAATDSDACPASFSFHGSAIGPDSPSQVVIVSPDCVPVSQGDVLELEVTYRAEALVHLEALHFGGTACSSGFLADLGPTLPAAGEWTVGRRSIEIESASATGVRFAVIAQIDPGPVSFVLDVDRAYLGRRYRIFADGFDGGSTCRWSNAN